MGDEVQSSTVLDEFMPGLTLWLTERMSELTPPLRAVKLPGGRSNLTFKLIDATGRSLVLRRPPLGAGAGTAHDVQREGRIMSNLGASGVPVPRVIGSTADVAVVGAPFFVMEFVDGEVMTDPNSLQANAAALERVPQAMVETLHAISSVELESVGLDDMRREDSYVERQLRGMLRRVKPDLDRLPLLASVHDALRAQAPAKTGSRMIHGDFKLGNVIVADSGDVRAVLDWELASTGDPLADIGWLVASWAEPGDGPWLVPPATSGGAFCSRSELAQKCATVFSRDLHDLDYYVAFAFWRWSCINVGTRQRHVVGTTPGKLDLAALDGQVSWQLERAADLLAGLKARSGSTAKVGDVQ
jgi:aminoglycoside phosphotransferase (APT) family kinase protein